MEKKTPTAEEIFNVHFSEEEMGENEVELKTKNTLKDEIISAMEEFAQLHVEEAKESHPFTKEDMIGFAEWMCTKYYGYWHSYSSPFALTRKELLTSEEALETYLKNKHEI